MPFYRYKARNADGKTVEGVLEAENESALYRFLADDRKVLLSSAEVGQEKRTKEIRIRAAALGDFFRQLGTMLGSGVTIVRALQIILGDQSLGKEERTVYRELLQLIKVGCSLSDAMKETDAFPEFAVNLVRSAENSGNLERAAKRLASHYEKQRRLSAKVSKTFVYPIFLLVMVVVVVVALSLFILPMFDNLFATMEDLPVLTKIVMGFGSAIAGYWYVFLIGFFVLWLVLSLLLRIRSVRRELDELKLRLPFFGPLLRKIYTARFALTFSTLYASGVSILNALQIASATVGNLYIEQQFQSVISDVRTGQSLSVALDRVDGFSKKMISSIRVGEESGSLESMLDSMSDNLTFEADMAIDKMVALLEPLTILILALIVGVMVIGVMLPIINSYGSISAGF